jgi:hypothetical protein
MVSADMLNLPLEPTDDHARPAFNNPASCKKWLNQFQFTNLQAAHATLRSQLDEFNRSPVRGLDRLKTLEMLRETVYYVQGDYAKRLGGKPLPLDEHELTTLNAVTGLWQGMAMGYRRCLQAYEAGDRQLGSLGALLCHRCLLYAGRQIFEHLRAGYEFDGTQWQQLHALYAFAEEQDLLSAKVEDGLSELGRQTSCHIIYLKTLLACHARPQELTRDQQQLLDRWILRWAAAITVDRTFTVSKGDAPPLAIDLTGTQGLQPMRPDTPIGDHMRYLAMVPISKLLRVKTILLQQGHTPKQLELDGDTGSEDCIELLTHLHRCWCEPRAQRLSERYGATHEMAVCYGLEDAFSFIANQPFNPMKKLLQETWRAEDIGMLGARLLRAEAKGVRLNANRLIAARIAGDSAYKLGNIVWISVTRDAQLRMGLHFFPGAPRAMTIKDAATIPGMANNRNAAALLPAMPDLGIPASLILPRNLFQPGRVMEATISPGGEKMRVKLGFSVEKGADYERVSFAPA